MAQESLLDAMGRVAQAGLDGGSSFHRRIALDQALRLWGQNGSDDTVLTTAKKFEQFLDGAASAKE